MTVKVKCYHCHRPAVEGKQLCEKHILRASYNPKRKRPPSSRGKRKRTISRNPKWSEFSRSYLTKNFLCVRCSASEKHVAASNVDHIIPLVLDPKREYDLDNLQALCHRCHSIKTKHEMFAGRAFDYKKGKFYEIPKLANLNKAK